MENWLPSFGKILVVPMYVGRSDEGGVWRNLISTFGMKKDAIVVLTQQCFCRGCTRYLLIQARRIPVVEGKVRRTLNGA
jgi:hypothetical protein